MKLVTIILFTSIFLFSSCEDDLDILGVEYLTKSKWQLDKMSFEFLTGSIDVMKFAGKDLETKPQVFLIFNTDNTYTIEDTEGILTFAGLLSEFGSWKLNIDSSTVVLNDGMDDEVNLKINGLTDVYFFCETNVHSSDLDLSEMENFQRKVIEKIESGDVYFNFYSAP